jgi:hypothetical protein
MFLLSIGFGLGVLFLRLAARHSPLHTDLGSLPATQWPKTWRQLWNNGWGFLAPHTWPYFLFGTAFAGLIQLDAPAKHQQARIAGGAAIAVGFAALTYFLFMGTRRWMVLNLCWSRYTLPAFFLLQGSFAIMATGQLGPGIRRWLNRHPYGVAALGLLLASLIGFHSPSVKRVRSDLERTLGQRTADILAADCTHVAGDYWKVWPDVFHANLVLREQGEKRTIWGITFRGWPTRSQWEHLPLEQFRIAVPLEDMEAAQSWLKAYQLPEMVVVEKRSTIFVLRPVVVVQREQQEPGSSKKEKDENTR